MGKKFLEFLSKKKTLLFLIMCLMVHAFNAGLFYSLGLYPFTVLNVFSTVFYRSVFSFSYMVSAFFWRSEAGIVSANRLYCYCLHRVLGGLQGKLGIVILEGLQWTLTRR